VALVISHRCTVSANTLIRSRRSWSTNPFRTWWVWGGAAEAKRWVRPPGSHPVTLAERDHLLGFVRSQTAWTPFARGDAVTSGDQRPTFQTKDADSAMGVVTTPLFQERSAIVAICRQAAWDRQRSRCRHRSQTKPPITRLLSQNPPWVNLVVDCHQLPRDKPNSCVSVSPETTQSKFLDPRLSVEQNRPNSLGRLEGNKRHLRSIRTPPEQPR